MPVRKCWNGVRVVLAVTICLVLVVAALAVVGCGEPSEEQKAETYRKEWKDIMDGFFKKLNEDDKEAEELSNQGDTAGVIKLVNERIRGIEETIDELMALDPPAELQRLQIVTLYFMLTLIDQLEAQNELNKAMVSGQPTTDLQTKVENMARRVGSIGNELSVEQVSAGIVLEEIPQPDTTMPESSQPESTQPESTQPESTEP